MGRPAWPRGSRIRWDTLSLPLGSLMTSLYTALRILICSFFRSESSSSSSSSNFGMRILRVREAFRTSRTSSSSSFRRHRCHCPISHLPKARAATLESSMSIGSLSTEITSFTVSLNCKISSPSSFTSTSCSSTQRFHFNLFHKPTSHSSCKLCIFFFNERSF